MKRTLLLILFTLLVVTVFAQVEQFEIIKTGEMNLVSGKAEIKTSLPKDYCVILTPQGQCGQLYVTEKTQNGFLVKETVVPGGKKSNSSFAYFVIEKKNIVVTEDKSNNKNIQKISKDNNLKSSDINNKKSE